MKSAGINPHNGTRYDYSTTKPQPVATLSEQSEWLEPLSLQTPSQPQQSERKQIDPFASFTDSFNQINSTLDVFTPQEPEINYREKYKKELANAFGIEPPTEQKLPNEIENLVRSIYDQT